MRVSLGQGLDLIQQPRSTDRGDYDWFDMEHDGIQVGKARCRIEAGQFTVFSIMVYPEHEGHGFARIVIEHFKQVHTLVIADRVRFTARGFWLKVGFLPESIDRYVWHRV